MKGHMWTEMETQAILERFPIEGAAQLAREFGISEDTLRRKANRMGLRSWKQERLRSNQQNLRTDAFDFWSAEMAYWLGYVYADGSVKLDKRSNAGTLSFTCQRRDRELLEGVRAWLGSSHQITDFSKRSRRSGKMRRYSRLDISNRAIVDSLIRNYGLVPNKSALGMTLPTFPSSDYTGPFVRGYFDGDGCINRDKRSPEGSGWRIYLVGSQSFMNEVSKLISSEVGLPAKEPRHRTEEPTNNPLYEVWWGAKSDLLKLRSWLYPEGQYPTLTRKQQRFQQVLA